MTPALPRLDEDGGKALTAAVRAAIESHGLVRTSRYAGGDNTGITTAFGSTGFSVAKTETGLRFHVVVSGKEVGLDYHEYSEWDDDGEERLMHEPRNPEKLFPRFEQAFRDLGFEVKEVKNSGFQMHWDDDVDFDVLTDHPVELGEFPEPTPPKRRYGSVW